MTVVPLDVLTLNRGDHAAYPAIRKAIRGHAFVALQEMFSVPEILNLLEDDGLGVWRGDRVSSRANPVVWDPAQIHVTERRTFSLLPAARRGGVHNMAKNLNLVAGRHIASGRRIAFGSAHNLHRQYLPGRGGPARELIREVVAWADEFGCARIIGMDTNAKPTGASLEPLRKAKGWDYDQLHRPVVTHGRGWSPDGFAFADSEREHVLTFVGHSAVVVPGTDHRGLSARFSLTVKN